MIHYTVTEREDREEQNILIALAPIGRGAMSSYSRAEQKIVRRLVRKGLVTLVRRDYDDGTHNVWITLVR